MQAIHIMKPGTHTDASGRRTTFSAADLASCASTYDPSLSEAPIVVGHPEMDAPAYGWIERLEARAEGLFAIPKQVNPEFAEMVQNGAFKKVSGSFYPPNWHNNPVPGTYYLRHVGFLGAAAPAVKGLQGIKFGEERALSFDFEEGIIDLREFRLSQREREFKRREDRAFLDELSQKGTLPISLREEAANFLESLSDDQVLEFSDEDNGKANIGQAEWFKKFLNLIPVPVPIGELAKGDSFASPVDFAAPDNFAVKPEALELHHRIVSYQVQHKVSFAEAAKAVSLTS